MPENILRSLTVGRLWTLEEFPFHPERLSHNETLMTLGNGYLATRGAFEEGYEGDMANTMVHGIFDHAPGMLVPELVNAPNWLPIEITIDGTPFQLIHQNEMDLKPKDGALLGYRRVLHLNKGLLRRECLFRAESGAIVRLVFERFTSLADDHILAQRVLLTAVDGNPRIEVQAYIEPDVTNAGVKHWSEPEFHTQGDQISLQVKTLQSGYELAMATHLNAPNLQIKRDGADYFDFAESEFTLHRGQPVELIKLTTIYTSRDTDQPVAAAQAKLQQALSQGWTALLQAHEAEWATYWDTSDIQIDGDEFAQFATRFVMYHILISAPRNDDDVSIGAKTLSGLGYKGHVFWDTELFILPPLILTQPKLARNLLMYRYHRLEGARNKAQANGYEGAMFPWESTDTGEETTPQWSDVQKDGSRIRIWTGDSEQHISTDVAYGVLTYWRWSGDDAFLTKHGAEIVLDTAVFWGSRVEWKAEHDRYELSQQIGPDEYHENVDNSVFTNRMVVWHMEQALEMLLWLKANAAADHDRLVAQLKLTPDRLDKWRDIIHKMYIPFDAEQQIHVQFPGFFDMEFIPVPDYEPRTASVQAILGHSRSIQTQVIKQADVVMLMALLGEEVGSREVMLNNWHTYFPRTDHGSSLSPAVHAWVAARLELLEEAYDMFVHAAEIDLRDNKGNVRDGIHGAASGGVIEALLFGFAGLHLDEAGQPMIAPRSLPAHWKSLTFSVYYRGEKRRFSVPNPG
jgi:kojibiose phosphorylase